MMAIKTAPDYRTFLFFLALNAHGYDLEGEAAMRPERLALRAAVKAVDRTAPSPPADAAWFLLCLPPWPRVSLAETYVLHQTSWPHDAMAIDVPLAGRRRDFDPWLEANQRELPGPPPKDLLERLDELGPILSRFATRVGAADLWHQHLDHHLNGAADLTSSTQVLLEHLTALLEVREWPFALLRVVPNLLQSSWLADQALIGDTLWTVIGPAVRRAAGTALHEAAHLAIRPPVAAILPELGRLAASSHSMIVGLKARMEPIGYWGPSDYLGLYRALQEHLVRAAVLAVECDEAIRRAAAAARHEVQGFRGLAPLAGLLLGRGAAALERRALLEAVELLLEQHAR